MSQYDGVENEEGGADRLPKLSTGEFLLEVQANKGIKTKRYGPAILGEFKVLESTTEANPPGTSAAYMLLEKDELFFKKLAAYVRGQTGSAKVLGADVEALISEENPAAGKKVRVRVHEETAKKSGNKYKKFDWRYVKED